MPKCQNTKMPKCKKGERAKKGVPNVRWKACLMLGACLGWTQFEGVLALGPQPARGQISDKHTQPISKECLRLH